MLLHLLGTAAYEGIPSLFCRCSLCQQARKLKGKDIRTRTSVVIDHELKIDFPPDTLLHMLRDDLDLEEIQDLLITHSHSDHLYAEDLEARLPGYAQSGEEPIHIYAHDMPLARIRERVGQTSKYVLHRVQLFIPTVTQTATVVALPAYHMDEETCLLYWIEKNGHTVLHAHDSGWFPDETWSWLEQRGREGNKLSAAILECTMGNDPDSGTHMNAAEVFKAKERLIACGAADPQTVFIVTHFSHNAHLTHQELCDLFEPQGIRVAYDSMKVQL
ncbi:MBL fold metallo-hydrolase [Paenibacillus arenosi]|uniref:Carbon-phosphorus lyase n=1 Tax=Paenibacillus arenosi TaxID=2774142 RepID=A0ABR9AWR3_9BACL|nr:MBL fold metallo-hydrolase [Paenibacillus arenosi]MBD8498094.1 carbon-phosphorus lyase [Paenibacillus arenosi]